MGFRGHRVGSGIDVALWPLRGPICGLRVKELGLRIQGLGFMIEGLGFRV